MDLQQLLNETLYCVVMEAGNKKEIKKAEQSVQAVKNAAKYSPSVALIIAAMGSAIITIIAWVVFLHYFSLPLFLILTIVLFIPLSKSMKADAAKKASTLDIDLSAAEAALAECKNNLQELYDSEEWAHMTEFYPKSYRDPDTIMIFCMYVDNKRCDSIKECVNLYEQEKRDDEKLALTRQQLQAALRTADAAEKNTEYAKKSLKYNKKAARNTFWTAWGTTWSEWFK
jgi:hypothetical protein